MKKKDLSGRIPIIDELRGLSIILMVIYHFFFDLVVLFDIDIPLFYNPFIQWIVPIFAGVFIFISGTACHFSRNNIKRGAICFGFGVVITVVTAFANSSVLDLFGIIHFLGISMMLFPLLWRLLGKLNPIIASVTFLILTVLTFHLPDGYIGVFGLFRLSLPDALYQTPFLFWLGFPNASFFSSDYFPLIPWLFCFLSGGFFGVLVKDRRLPKGFYISRIKPLAFVGRHTMIIYLLHQPIILGFLILVSKFI